ncbi:MAG: HAD-IIB family hydrolase [Lachnospiraceae bacterium]
MKRKYFFFDIDGTLTEKESRQMVPSAQEAIDRLKAAGHFVSIATGRAYYKAEPFRAAHHFDHMVCNGGHGIVIDGKLVENSPLDKDKCLALYREAISLGYGVLVATEDSTSVHARDFRFYDQCGIRKEPTVYIIDETFDPANAPAIYKMYISVPKEEEARLTLLSTIGHMRFEPEYLLLQPDEKHEGILRMLELVGGQPEDVVVFGDDTNDLCMFDPAFTSVAMGNATDPELFRRATLVAPKNIEDGIFRICEEQGWF